MVIVFRVGPEGRDVGTVNRGLVEKFIETENSRGLMNAMGDIKVSREEGTTILKTAGDLWWNL